MQGIYGGKMKYSVAKPVFHGNERKYLLDAFDSTWISSIGKYIDKFENEFAKYCDTKYALTCSNGTTALHLAMLAIGINSGDEVIVPTFTYIATANAVSYCGAKPIFVDCRHDTWNIDENLIEKAITKRTKAIIVVHIYGHPCEMEIIWRIAKKHNLIIIEDAAEAHGAIYYSENKSRYNAKRRILSSNINKNKVPIKVGSLGNIAIFSLFGNKIITSGEGGIITTNDDKIAEKIKLLKDQGMSKERRYWFPIIGYNYRMTNLQAAIALAQLENIDWHLNRRRTNAEIYNNYLKHSEFINCPIEVNNVKHVYWMYSIILTDNCRLERDNIINKLKKYGIETRPFFYPMNQLPPYYKNNNSNNYPIADKISSRGINLPSGNNLEKSDIEEICKILLQIVKIK